MAQIHTEELVICVHQLAKDGVSPDEILTPELRAAIAEFITPAIEQLVGGKSVVIEVK